MTGPNSETRRLIWLGLFLLWNVAIFWFSSQPTLPDAGFTLPGLDKVQHASAYAVGGALLFLALPSGRTSHRPMIAALAVMLAIGISDEFHQTFTPGRSGNDLGDLTADLIGAATGILAARGLRNRGRRRQLSPS